MAVRGSNPVWFFVDLTAHAFDDTFYMFVLENTIPYIPATVWHDPEGTIPWSQPIQFYANGTLPIDIYFDPDVVYRLEFRHGDSQSDPLEYLVENYVPGQGGDTPVDVPALVTDNQFTNPQFSLISFSSPYTVTSAGAYEVAPGWFLVLTGSGTAVIAREALDSSLANPTNAPYALHITLSGSWTDAYLRQRFNQAGMLWASTADQDIYVANSVTARVDGLNVALSAILLDSMGAPLTTVLDVTVNNAFNEYSGHGLMPVTTNTNVPPAAYIEYRLILPTSVDIYITSLQLTASTEPFEPLYQQDTIERQVDQTFHYYRDSLLRQEKDSLLVGWDFGLNPWQFTTTAQTNVATFGYIADQTIIIPQAYVAAATGNHVSAGRASFTQNYGFKVASVTATNQFAMIQFIDPTSCRDVWGNIHSVMIKLDALKQSSVANTRLKVQLIYKAALPTAPMTQTDPIASWAALGEPVYAAGWTAVNATNNPSINLINGKNTLVYEGFTLPASSNADMTLGIVVYTVDPMIQSGTPDNIVFNKISLVQNDFAIDVNSKTFEEVLAQCQYYYENTIAPGTLPTTVTTGQRAMPQAFAPSGGNTLTYASTFDIVYNTIKRKIPAIEFYSASSPVVTGDLTINLWSGSTILATANYVALTYWEPQFRSVKNTAYRPKTNTTLLGALTGAAMSAAIYFNCTIDARLGVV